MTRTEMLVALRNARRATDSFRLDRLYEAKEQTEKRELADIEVEVKALLDSLKAARMMGPSGSVCECCKGSGRA